MTTAGLHMTSAGLIMTSAGLIMTSARLQSCSLYICVYFAHFKRFVCIFTPEHVGKMHMSTIKRSNFHLKYNFLTPGGPHSLPTKYRNFAQSPFKNCHGSHSKLTTYSSFFKTNIQFVT